MVVIFSTSILVIICHEPEDPGRAAQSEEESEESIENVPETESEEIILTDSESEVEFLRSDEQEQENELEYEPSEDDEEFQERTPSPSPDREVLFTPSRSTSAIRNKRRRQRKKLQREQESRHVTDRLDTSHPKMRLGTQKPPRQWAPTSSTEIVSDTDARAEPRPAKFHDAKRRRESQESIEELDSQGTKVPTKKNRNRRQ